MKSRILLSLSVAFALLVSGAVPAQAAIIYDCTVKFSLPSKISIDRVNKRIGITTPKSVDCFEVLKLELTRTTDDRVAANPRVYSGDPDYQNGLLTDTFGNRSDFSLPGTYQLSKSTATLAYDWAQQRGYNKYENYGHVPASNTMVVKYASKVSSKATRTIKGSKLTGKVTRFHLADRSWESGWQPMPRTKVVVQKKVGKTWKTHKTVKTSASGTYSASLPAKSAGTWRAVTPTTAQVWSSTSKARSLKSFKKNKAKLSSVKSEVARDSKWNRVRDLSGTVRTSAGSGYSGTSGVKAKLQVKKGKKWVTVKTVKSKKAGALKARVKNTDTRTYRWQVASTKQFKGVTSKSMRA